MNIADMFPARYCGGRHLPAGGVLIEIQNVKPEKMRAGQGKPEETKPVLYAKRVAGGQIAGVQMAGGVFGAVLRKRLAEQIALALGSPETDDWHGKRVVLYPCEARAAGEIVTSICARAPKPTQPSEAQPQPETTGAPAQ